MATPPSPRSPAAAPGNAGNDPRMAGLSTDAIARMQAAARAIRDGKGDLAGQLLDEVLATAPEHPEALRLFGILHNVSRRPGDAVAMLRRALAQRPDDPHILSDLASAQMAGGDPEAALASWRQACERAPDQAMPWFNLGRNLQLRGATEEAVTALQKSLALAPDFLPATILLGDAQVHLGRFDEAAASYRAALKLHPRCGNAWRGLANIKTHPLTIADRDALVALLRRNELEESDRIAIGYALGKVEEDLQRYPQAFAALSDANARLRRRAPWSAAALSNYVDAALAATMSLPAPLDSRLGEQAILIVGLPRSGSTLLEQMLAAHPQVEGASELPDLGEVIQAESARRGQRYPDWIAQATAEDWHRLGCEYLQRTARWRTRRPRFTDKMPENWKHAGVLRAMLPGATVIDMRRDPVETGWSCFKQQFYQLPHFSCDLSDIAAYLYHCERAMDEWRGRDPSRIHRQHYEALIADPDQQMRALLAVCGLPYDERCLAFHRASRSVRTASAAQVRQPLRADTARALFYGALLDPLREALTSLQIFFGS